MPRKSALFTLIAVGWVLGGCSGLPVAGPSAAEVVQNRDAANPAHVNYVVIDVTESVCRTLSSRPPESFRGTFGTGGPPPQHTIGVGDALAITIWEAGTGGLFSNPIPITQAAPSSRGVSLPELVVTQDGEISVPYAGRLPVLGKYPAEVEMMITAALQGKAVEPQVVVTVVRTIQNSVTLGGEVTAGARISLSVKGDRVLDAIAAAGGVRAPVNEAVIRLTRGDRTVSVPFLVAVQNPDENIYLLPGDVLTIVRSPQTFTAFGALGRNVQIPFEADAITAEEAIAKAGGLIDQRADPSGLFLLRFEDLRLVQQLAPGHPERPSGEIVPVIYHLDMREAGSYFLARQFNVRDKDIVYVANAPLNEVQKFVNLLGSVLGPAANAATIEYTLSH
jgi:polysaccharide export outer membrane protein